MARAERKILLKKIEKARGSKVFCYLTSDRPNLTFQMSKDILPVFVEQLRANKTYKKIDIFMFTVGGDILTGFGLSRLLRQYSSWVGALVAEKCYSAGTLFALGADEILMTKGATLSPIDPSITRPLNPAVQLNPAVGPQLIPISVESVAGFKSLVSEDWGLSGEASLSSAFRLLAEKVHPLALGDLYRTRQQIERLATNLLKQHRNDEDRIKEIVDTLAKRLGSHDYLIYRSEAEQLLGGQIVKNDSVEALIWELYLDFAKEMELGVAYTHKQALHSRVPAMTALPNGVSPGFIMRSIAADLQHVVIESLDRRDVFEEKIKYSEQFIKMNLGLPVSQVDIEQVSIGWNRHP